METIELRLDEGKAAAKVATADVLVLLMREIVGASGPNPDRRECVQRWREALADRDDYTGLLDHLEEHEGTLIFNRCVAPNDDKPARERIRARLREVIAADIILSAWIIPVAGKPLSDCTFGELAEAAPIAGRFLAKLAAQGAPGTPVKEVFPTEQALQDFWDQQQTS